MRAERKCWRNHAITVKMVRSTRSHEVSRQRWHRDMFRELDMSKRLAICDVFAAFVFLLGASAVDCWAQDEREPDSSKGTPQKGEQEKPKDKPEAANIDSLTKLRREQKKRDP